MGSKLDIVGKKFGKLTVLEFSYSNKHGKRCFKCLCECGKEKIVVGSSLISGLTTSCGCFQKEKVIKSIHKRCIKHKNEYYIEDDIIYFTVMDSQNTIHKVFIDKEDIEKCKLYQWKFDGKGYIINHKVGLLHRFLMNADKGMDVDHINHNKLDNRKHMLRICKHINNMQNRKSKGYIKDYNKYVSKITVNKENIKLGSFNTKEEAIQTKRCAEKKYFGEYAYNYDN